MLNILSHNIIVIVTGLVHAKYSITYNIIVIVTGLVHAKYSIT